MDNPDRSEADQIDEIAELISSLTYGEVLKLASELRKVPIEMEQIERLAKLMRGLTYGEMLEFASALRNAARDTEITAETLPTILHRWASEHGKQA